MAETLILALDAMGGDRAPDIVVKGANIARERTPGLQFVFYGDAERIERSLKPLKKLQSISTVVHCKTAIPDDMKASQALRLGRDSSMYHAIQAATKGEAHGVLSAGNTGALMALAKMASGTIPGVRRPAITSFLPTFTGETVMLDLGANIDCDGDILAQFALMGHLFGKAVFNWDNPSVGLLNVGVEHQKGREDLKKAASILKDQHPDINFYGFIEGNDISTGKVDVVVTDGFTGNIALKTAEGTARLISEYIRQTFRSSMLAQLGYLIARPAFNKLRHRLDPRRYNGAVFLGLNHIVLKSHGGTDALGFAAAIDVAVELMQSNCLEQMRILFAEKQAAA